MIVINGTHARATCDRCGAQHQMPLAEGTPGALAVEAHDTIEALGWSTHHDWPHVEILCQTCTEKAHQ